VNESGILKEEAHVSVENHAHVSTDTHMKINNESVDEISASRSELHEVRLEIEGLCNKMNMRDETLAALRVELNTANENLSAANESLSAIGTLEEALKVQTTKAKRFWSQKCEQLLSHEVAMEEKEKCIAAKDAEITRLQEELEVLRGATLSKHEIAHGAT